MNGGTFCGILSGTALGTAEAVSEVQTVILPDTTRTKEAPWDRPFCKSFLRACLARESCGTGVLKKVLLEKADLQLGRVQMVNWADLGVGKRFARHYHEDMQEIFIIVQGEAEITAGTQTAMLRRGDAVVIDAREVHQMRNVGTEPVGIWRWHHQRGGGKTVVGDEQDRDAHASGHSRASSYYKIVRTNARWTSSTSSLARPQGQVRQSPDGRPPPGGETARSPTIRRNSGSVAAASKPNPLPEQRPPGVLLSPVEQREKVLKAWVRNWFAHLRETPGDFEDVKPDLLPSFVPILFRVDSTPSGGRTPRS